MLSDFMVASDIDDGTLVHVLPDWSGRDFDVHAVYPARQNIPPRLALFVDHLAKALNPPPWAKR